MVFEDSVSGLQAGKASGAFIVGLLTTNPEKIVREYSDLMIRDFNDFRISEIGFSYLV